MNEKYQAILDDLLAQQTELTFQLANVNREIALFRKITEGDAATRITSAKYSLLGTRKAILKLLVENTSSPMTTGQIINALLAGGIRRGSGNFRQLVYTTLSNMKRQSKEVIYGPAGWTVSEKGKSVWLRINGY